METPWNVLVRLDVVRPDSEYLPALLAKRIDGWDSYAGHIKVRDVSVIYGEEPFPEGGAQVAISSLRTAIRCEFCDESSGAIDGPCVHCVLTEAGWEPTADDTWCCPACSDSRSNTVEGYV